MRDTFDPFDVEERGPKGGNLFNPNLHPAARRASFNGSMDRGLHRFNKGYDTASVGSQDEQPWHRMAAYMLNAGRTNSEIAIAAGVTPQTVSILRSNKWFQELCATIANEHGEELLGALQSEALDSLNTIIELRDGSENDRVRLSAAVTILEQAHGKPIQKIVSDISHRAAASPTEEMEAIQAELAAIRQRDTPKALPPIQEVHNAT